MKQNLSLQPSATELECLTARVPKQTAQRMKEIATARDRSLAGELRRAISGHIEEFDRELERAA